MLDQWMPRTEIEAWLREKGPERLRKLWREADRARRATVGDEVHLRGLIEISSHCRRKCLYCGLRAPNVTVRRYRLTSDDILTSARRAREIGCGTVVLQSGEDPGLGADWVTGLVERIVSETGLAVTLSLGERSPRELAQWRAAGAKRYLLRFETSDRALLKQIHPPISDHAPDRFALLEVLRSLGYETGGGVMVGLPGQTFATLARDIEIFRSMDLDMIGLGPYVPHPGTPLGSGFVPTPGTAGEQVPDTETMTFKVLALTRIVRPDSNIPSTTAVGVAFSKASRNLGLLRGANVIMPNFTPQPWRSAYEIYPGKGRSRLDDGRTSGVDADVEAVAVLATLRQMNRPVGEGPGSRVRAGLAC